MFDDICEFLNLSRGVLTWVCTQGKSTLIRHWTAEKKKGKDSEENKEEKKMNGRKNEPGYMNIY